MGLLTREWKLEKLALVGVWLLYFENWGNIWGCFVFQRLSSDVSQLSWSISKQQLNDWRLLGLKPLQLWGNAQLLVGFRFLCLCWSSKTLSFTLYPKLELKRPEKYLVTCCSWKQTCEMSGLLILKNHIVWVNFPNLHINLTLDSFVLLRKLKMANFWSYKPPMIISEMCRILHRNHNLDDKSNHSRPILKESVLFFKVFNMFSKHFSDDG